MNYLKNFLKYFFILIILGGGFNINASVTNGTIDGIYSNAFLCLSDDCTNNSQINFKTTNGSPVEITDTGLVGYAWSETFGWINLNPTNSGVTNTPSGILGGYAWGENSGWINFNPTNGGVTIDNEGQFDGYAWAENYGWVKFDCDVDDSCVKTDWRPEAVRENNTGSRRSGYLINLPIFFDLVKEPVEIKIEDKNDIEFLEKNYNQESITKDAENEEIIEFDENKEPSKLDQEYGNKDTDNNIYPKSESLDVGSNFSVRTKYLNKVKDFMDRNIFSDYFYGLSFYYNIFGYEGYINPFFLILLIIFILLILFLVIKRTIRH